MVERLVTVVVTAAGSGQRFNAATPKQFALLRGIPILARTLLGFNALNCINRIAVTVPEGYTEMTWRDIVEPYALRKVTQITAGGVNRQQSVYKALLGLAADTDIVLIHDGVRPFITEQTIREVIGCAAEGAAAVTGVKSTDTIKLTDAQGQVFSTPDRELVWSAQTPQGFLYETILAAHRQAESDGFIGTDDAVLVERKKFAPVRMVPGGSHNLKITTPEDIWLAEALIDYNT